MLQSTRNLSHTRLGVVAVAYYNGIEYLRFIFAWSLFWFYFPFLLLLHESHAHYLRFEPHQLINPELAREVLQIPQNLLVTRVPSRVSVRVIFGDERVAREAHALSGEVGAEGLIEAGVDLGPGRVESNRVGFDFRGVNPGAANLVASFEYNHAVALAAELYGSY